MDRDNSSQEVAPAESQTRGRAFTANLLYVFELAEGTDVWANRALTTALGYTLEDLWSLGAPILPQILHHEDAPGYQAHLAKLRVLADGEVAEFVGRMRRRDGRWLWLSMRDMVFRRDDAGVVKQIVGSAYEVTVQREAVHARTASERDFRAVAETLPHALWETDADGRTVYMNQRWTEYTGLSAAGGCWLEAVHPEDAAALHASWQEARATGQDYDAFCRLRRGSDGTNRWFRVRVAPGRDAEGRIVRWVGTHSDVHEQYLAEQTLRRTEARLRTMADGLPLIVWVHDVEGALQYVNRTYCEFFGVTPEQVQGGAWQVLTHPEDAARYTAEFEACVRAHRPFHAEVRVRNAAGEWRWMESWAQPHFSATGQLLDFVGTSADITDRKAAEARLVETQQKLEEAAAAKDRFLAALGHELRTPLTPVLLIAHMRQRSPGVSEEIRDDFAMIERNIQMEVRLVDDMLDVARIQTGKLRYDMQPCPVQECVARAVAMVQPDADAKNVMLDINYGTDPCIIEGDCDRLVQLFGNLLRNAVKFTPPRGEVRVRLQSVDAHVRVSVRDSGIGVSQEHLERIFRPFEQVDSHAPCEHRSLGLGLAICAAIATAHGGRIWAESEGLGHGATFFVEFPCQPAESRPPAS